MCDNHVMRPRRATFAAMLVLGAVLTGCGRSGDEPVANAEPPGRGAISEAIGDDLGGRDLVRLESVRGRGVALRGAGAAGLAHDDDWIMRAPAGWQLGRLAAERDERVFAWLRDGEPLLSTAPVFAWEQVSVEATGGAGDRLALMPEDAHRPRGYIVDLRRLDERRSRALAVVGDAVQRELTDVQAEGLIEIVRELGRLEDEQEHVLDWLERMARGEVALATLERVDLGPAEDELFGPHHLELRRATLDAGAPAMHALRDAAAVVLLPSSDYRRRGPLGDLLEDPRMSEHVFRSLRDHQPLPEPMAATLVDVLGPWVERAGPRRTDALRVQVTAVLDALGGHDWELMTGAQREAAERRLRERGGERHHLDAAVDLAVVVLRHDNFEIQQTALRMIQRWVEWGWELPQRRRLEAVARELQGEARAQLLATLEAD